VTLLDTSDGGSTAAACTAGAYFRLMVTVGACADMEFAKKEFVRLCHLPKFVGQARIRSNGT